MLDVNLFLQGATNGLISGAVFALVAAGLTLIFGVMRIVNFAHGEFLMIAMYTTYLVSAFGKLPPYLAVIVTLPVLFLLGWALFQLLIKPILNAPEMAQLLMTMGASIFIQNVGLMIFRGDPLSINVPWGAAGVHLGSITIGLTRLIAAVACLMGTFGLYWILKRTDLGRMVRAASQDRDAAQLMGINVYRMYMVALCIGVACLGVVGPFMAPWSYMSPDMGNTFISLVVRNTASPCFRPRSLCCSWESSTWTFCPQAVSNSIFTCWPAVLTSLMVPSIR